MINLAAEPKAKSFRRITSCGRSRALYEGRFSFHYDEA